MFKSPESGSQGMFLGGDPSYVQKDRALIKELGLNLKHVVAGRRAGAGRALDAAVQAEEAGALLLVRPAVPERGVRPVSHPAADALQGLRRRREASPASTPASTRRTGSTSSSAATFAKSGSPALKVIRKFKWTSADQNFVANLISGKKMAKDKAAALWVKTHKASRSTPGSSEPLRRARSAEGRPPHSRRLDADEHLAAHHPPARGRRGAVSRATGLLRDPRADRHARARTGLDS